MIKAMCLLKYIFILIVILLYGCQGGSGNTRGESNVTQSQPGGPATGCAGYTYPETTDSLYMLPFVVDSAYQTGLTNCSSSFHSAGQADQLAYDFNMPVGTPFLASRSGRVYRVVENAASEGGGVGNYVVIDHHDGTYGLYYHSPKEGIYVDVGEDVVQGQILGETGRSGLAGYPHLHFIVVRGSPDYPYEGEAISFRNAIPDHKILESNTVYTAGP